MDVRPEALSPPHVALIDDDTAHGRRSSASDFSRPYELARVFELVRRRAAVIVTSVAIGGAASVFAAYALKPTYTATALLAVSELSNGIAPRDGDVSIDTQIAMLQSPVFIQRAFETIARDNRLKDSVPRPIDLERRFKVVQQLRSRLIALRFSAKSPTDAADIVNRIARLYVEDPLLQSVASVDDASDTFAQQIVMLEAALQRVEGKAADGQTSSSRPSLISEAAELRDQIAALKLSESLARRRKESRDQTLALSPPVQLVALAQPPVRPSSLNPVYMVIAGTVSSGVLGTALALLLGALDKRIYRRSDLVENFDAPCGGAVPSRRRKRISAMFRGSTPGIGYLHAIDAVVTATLLMQRAQKRTVLVTTADRDAGAYEFALSFAAAAARLRRRVLVIDIDTTRRSRRSRKKREPIPGPGIAEVLAGRCPPNAAIQTIPTTDLDCLPSGFDSNADGLALIANGRLKQLMADVRLNYDWVIVNGPPVIGVSETRLIAAIVDTAILVVRSGRSRFPEVEDALGVLSKSMTGGVLRDEPGSKVVTVLTEAPRQSLPARYRDERAVRRSSGSHDRGASTTRSPPEESPERSNEIARADADVNCVDSRSGRGQAAVC